MRVCYLCRHTCIFSAVACECSRERVACVRHFSVLCKCPKEKKFLLSKYNTPLYKYYILSYIIIMLIFYFYTHMLILLYLYIIIILVYMYIS